MTAPHPYLLGQRDGQWRPYGCQSCDQPPGSEVHNPERWDTTMIVQRETSPLEQLHGGWPFGPGPDQWAWFLEVRGATEIQPEGIHMCCGTCGQSVSRIGSWWVSWEKLKPQIALHVMQVHLEQVTG